MILKNCDKEKWSHFCDIKNGVIFLYRNFCLQQESAN
jgi:hypothetical protein